MMILILLLNSNFAFIDRFLDNSVPDEFYFRSNRANSVEPNRVIDSNDMKVNNGHRRPILCHQRSLPNGSKIQYDNTSTTMNKQFNSSDTIDQSM